MSGLNNKRNIDNQLNQFMNTNIEKENWNADALARPEILDLDF